MFLGFDFDGKPHLRLRAAKVGGSVVFKDHRSDPDGASVPARVRDLITVIDP